MLIGSGKVLRLYLDTYAALPPLVWAANSHFPVFLHYERRKTGNCSFTAALIGGKVVFQFSSTVRGGKLEIAALPPLQSAVKLIFQVSSALKGGKLAVAGLPLLSSAVKWIFQFSSAVRGGKLEIADTLRVHLAEIYQSDFLSCFPFLCFLVGHGSRLSSTK